MIKCVVACRQKIICLVDIAIGIGKSSLSINIVVVAVSVCCQFLLHCTVVVPDLVCTVKLNKSCVCLVIDKNAVNDIVVEVIMLIQTCEVLQPVSVLVKQIVSIINQCLSDIRNALCHILVVIEVIGIAADCDKLTVHVLIHVPKFRIAIGIRCPLTIYQDIVLEYLRMPVDLLCTVICCTGFRIKVVVALCCTFRADVPPALLQFTADGIVLVSVQIKQSVHLADADAVLIKLIVVFPVCILVSRYFFDAC